DATNVVSPVVSVLSAIDLDHERHLGSRLSEVAREKCGIIKAGVSVVSASQHPEVAQEIRRHTEMHGSILFEAAQPLPSEIAVRLEGSHQRANASVAVET